jgi:hypothetical protein
MPRKSEQYNNYEQSGHVRGFPDDLYRYSEVFDKAGIVPFIAFTFSRAGLKMLA